jgi:N-acetylneuraminate synthase
MSVPSARDREIFENLFVLEAANNHWGNVDRGLKIVRDFGTVVRYNNIKAAIKFQFRQVDDFIHQDFAGNKDVRYISKTEATKLNMEQFSVLIKEVVNVGCIPMATPFDEASVDMCVAFDMPIIKVASSDINDWPLLEKIASVRRPVIVSSGGASEKNLDEVVSFFEHRDIPLAINHCVSLYPSEDHELELNQIDYLKERFPEHVIGFSTHEYHDWEASMHISYGKGARTWERHVDIDHDGVPVSPYCSLPENTDTWFKAFHKAREMSGGSSTQRRVLPKKEIEYLDALVRGVYAKKDIEPGYVFSRDSFEDDFYMAIPLLKGQLSCREIMNGEKLLEKISAHEALSINHIDGPYHENDSLRALILNRGLSREG